MEMQLVYGFRKAIAANNAIALRIPESNFRIFAIAFRIPESNRKTIAIAFRNPESNCGFYCNCFPES
jgi:hypothetical protein